MSENNEGITFTRIFEAPKEKVWQAWTDPEMTKKWWGPKDFTAPSIKIDLRVGGKYIFCMHGPAGSEWDKDMYSAGEYKEIVPNEKLVVSDYFSDKEGNKVSPTEYGQEGDFPEETVLTVRFEEVETGKTKLSIEYPPMSPEQREAMLKTGMEEGWKTTLDKLGEVVEK